MKVTTQIIEKTPPYIFTLVAGLAVCWLTLVPNLLPSDDLHLFAHADKVVHFILFGVFAAAVFIDLWRISGKSSRVCAVTAIVSATLCGGIIELLQGGMDLGRSADAWDFIADTAGAVVSGLICAKLSSKHPCLSKCDTDSPLEIVKEIYMESFPASERRPWNDILRRIDTVGSPFSLTLLLLRGKVEGFITSWNFDDFVYIEHFAVASSSRNSGTGARALRRFCRAARKPVVLEAEPHTDGDMAKRRIRFYERNGFFPFYDFKYIQPPYAPELPEVELVIMANDKGIDLHKVEKTLHTIVYDKK